MVISVALHGDVIDDEVSFDKSLLLILFNNRWTVQVHLVIHN